MIQHKDLLKKSLLLGATYFGDSTRKNKRFQVVYNGKVIHFGLKGGKTYIDYPPSIMADKIRKAWRARHSKIKLKDGRYAYKVKEQPEYWAYNLLW